MLWVEVLNRATTWTDPQSAGRDLDVDLGPDPGLYTVLRRDVDLLRATYVRRAMGAAASGSEADVGQWLAAVTLTNGSAAICRGFNLPTLRATRHSKVLPADLDLLLSTALVQLLTAAPGVEVASRCHGLRRDAVSPFAAADDQLFAVRAGLVAFRAMGLTQCPLLVASQRLGRYCSKACSNATFAVRKAVSEPRYFAAKQASYRDRRRRPEPARRSESAFAFVD